MNIFFNTNQKISPNQITQSLIEEIDHAYVSANVSFHDLIFKAKECSHIHKGKITENLRQELKSRVDALRFLLGIHKEEKDSQLRSVRFEALKGKLLEWQQKNLWFSSDANTVDSELLKKIEKYPHLVKRLVGSEILLDQFARFSLVYQCGEADSVEIFAHHISSAAKINRAGLVPSIGQYKGLELHDHSIFLKNEGSLVHISDVNLLSILKRMEKENHKDTDRECPFFYGPQGISKFNRYLNGLEIDLEKKNYFEDLPKTGIYLSYEAMQRKIPNLKQEEWVFSMKAGRRYNSISAKETHSWVEIYKPIENKQYELLMSVGLWEKEVPKSEMEWFSVTMGSITGTIAVFENRVLERMHQVRGEWFSLSKKEALDAVQERIRLRLIDAKKGLIPFQTCEHNCLKFAADLTQEVVGKERFEERVPSNHLYRSLFEIEIDPKVNALFQTLQNLPVIFSTPIYWLIKTVAGQYTPFVIQDSNGNLKSITVARDSRFSRTNQVPLPSHFIASGTS